MGRGGGRIIDRLKLYPTRNFYKQMKFVLKINEHSQLKELNGNITEQNRQIIQVFMTSAYYC